MAKRKTLSRLARVRIFDAAGGVCHLCGQKISASLGETWQADHVKPLWGGGEDTEAAMKPAHTSCHQIKTSAEAPMKAKADRMRAKYLGIPKPGKRPWPKRPFATRKESQ